MKFSVTWKSSAERELAEIWNAAADQQRVADAANAIDSALRRTPTTVGESREDEFRVHFVAPIGIFYYVSEADLRVIVLQVWRIRE